MFCGFSCTKHSLSALNVLYVLVSVLLVGVTSWAHLLALVSSVRVVAVALAVGCFLFLVAVMGLCGALRQNQILLFFYMVVLFLVFVMQFSVSCACLTINKQQQDLLLEVGWNRSEATQRDVERSLNCCGFNQVQNTSCTAKCAQGALCQPCAAIVTRYTGDVLSFVGGVGLFFSFTEFLSLDFPYPSVLLLPLSAVSAVAVFYSSAQTYSQQIVGVWLAHRLRNLKDPRKPPGAFL